MGLPVHKLVCASNANNVLTDFIRTGVYDRNRPFYTTQSPSMDILVSSNLERLLYDLSGCDDEKVRSYMRKLKECGRYEVDDDVKAQLSQLFYGGWCSDEQAQKTIRTLFEKERYLCDTHTAVAVCVYDQYKRETGDNTPAVIVSTASPYKFTHAVLQALTEEPVAGDDFKEAEALSELTKTQIPQPIAALRTKQTRFSLCCEKEEMEGQVLSALQIG